MSCASRLGIRARACQAASFLTTLACSSGEKVAEILPGTEPYVARHLMAASRVGFESSESKVKSMAKDAAERKEKSAKPAKHADPLREERRREQGKKGGESRRTKLPPKRYEAPKEEKPKPAPRPPADLRLKVLKKFYGKFLPRGPLRERHRALMARWNSGEDHGGVTVEELKSLLEDWKASRAKTRRKVAVSH